jgi:hypothetical protein
MISVETFQSFSKAITDSRFLLGDDELVAYLNETRKRAANFQAITISMEALPPGDEKSRASATAGELRVWLIDQIDGLPKRFESALHLQRSVVCLIEFCWGLVPNLAALPAPALALHPHGCHAEIGSQSGRPRGAR